MRARSLIPIPDLFVFAAVLGSNVLADPGKLPTIKEIMHKAHQGPNSILPTVGKDLRNSDGPDWDEIKRAAKELVRLGTALGKNEPPKGEKNSWQKLTKAYVESAKALLSAAEKSNQAAAELARKKLQSSCTGCHKSHRPN
jgi:cytochrome c556